MKATLVDDERLAMQNLERLLLAEGGVEIVGMHINPLAALESIPHDETEVVFLDIDMPEINGIEVAEKLLELKPKLEIVFVTAYDEYAIKAFDVNAIDYILKPVGKDRLLKTLQRLRSRLRTGEEAVQTQESYLTIHVLGKVQFSMSNRETPTIRWRTAKALEIFLYLLHHRGQLVQKDVLIDQFWPDHEQDKVHAQLYTTIYYIRKTLEPFGNRFKIQNNFIGYMLEIENAIIDAEAFESNLFGSPPISAATVGLHLEILKTYGGDYLQDHEFWWAESNRHRLKTKWVQHAFQVAECLTQSKAYFDAIDLYHQICERFPLTEEAYFALMKIHHELGDHLSVKTQYRKLTEILLEEVNVSPKQSIVQWYVEWERSSRSV